MKHVESKLFNQNGLYVTMQNIEKYGKPIKIQ